MSRAPDGAVGAAGAGADRCLNPSRGRRAPDRPAEWSGQGGRLLLVEDDSALRQMLAWELSEQGYVVRAVARRP